MRPYSSPARQRAAEATRLSILEAARELFVANGYVATTIEQIAAKAGVSKPTVFASAGNKRDIIKALRDRSMAGDDVPVAVADRSWFQEALAEPDGRRSLRLHARTVVQLHRSVADVNEVLRMGAGADEELRRLWEAAERERRTDAARFIDVLGQKGPLKQGLDRETAIDILWLLTNSDVFQRLVRTRRWSVARYEEWLATTFIEQLLPPEEGR